MTKRTELLAGRRASQAAASTTAPPVEPDVGSSSVPEDRNDWSDFENQSEPDAGSESDFEEEYNPRAKSKAKKQAPRPKYEYSRTKVGSLHR